MIPPPAENGRLTTRPDEAARQLKQLLRWLARMEDRIERIALKRVVSISKTDALLAEIADRNEDPAPPSPQGGGGP